MQSKSTKNIVLDVIRGNRLLAGGMVLIVICVTLLSLLPPQILKRLIDEHLAAGRMEGLLTASFLYLGVFALGGIFDFLKGVCLTAFGQKLVSSIRYEMARKMTRIEAGYFSANSGGTIASRFLNDVENVNALFSDGIISMMIDCFKVVGIVISIWLFNAPLGVFVLCLLPFIYLLTTFFRRRMLASQKKNLVELGRVNNHIAESIKNVWMIKSFHKEEYMESRYQGLLNANYQTMNRVNGYNACYSPIIQIVTALACAAVLLLACGQNGAFGISIGMLAATIAFITNLFDPIDNLGTELQSIQMGISGIQSVDEFLAQQEEIKTETEMDLEELRTRGASLRFEQVSFSYDEASPVLKQIDLAFPPHMNICFVGRTGVGKTTTFKLITGMLRPVNGTIYINGTDVYTIPNSQKRSIFGYVEQHFTFVRGDVSMQLSLGDESITREDILRAMQFVGLHEYIQRLPKGYETEAGNGSQFSQGQKQLFSIARAIVSDPVILLLDEVTANLDSVTEDMVVNVLKKLSGKKTILSITHRVSSMLGADRVILLENGRVTADGSPTDIIDQSSWLRRSVELGQ